MMFGMVLQEDEEGKVGKIKTRSGESVKLMELLDEGKNRMIKSFEERKADESSKVQVDEKDYESTAEIMSTSAIKYFDLRTNRTQNYVFSFDKMLDMKGNTGVYLLYSYVRILSIMRKGNYSSEEDK